MWPISSEVQCTNQNMKQKHTTSAMNLSRAGKHVTAAKGGKTLTAVKSKNSTPHLVFVASG